MSLRTVMRAEWSGDLPMGWPTQYTVATRDSSRVIISSTLPPYSAAHSGVPVDAHPLGVSMGWLSLAPTMKTTMSTSTSSSSNQSDQSNSWGLVSPLEYCTSHQPVTRPVASAGATISGPNGSTSESPA